MHEFIEYGSPNVPFNFSVKYLLMDSAVASCILVNVGVLQEYGCVWNMAAILIITASTLENMDPPIMTDPPKSLRYC